MGESVVPAGESTDAMMNAYVKNIDDVIAATSRNILPNELAQLDAQSVIAPRQSQLSLDLARQFLPQFTALDSQIASQRAAADAEMLRTTGKDVVSENLALQQMVDPEFFATREKTAASIDELLASLGDPNAGLSDTERAEIERATARSDAARGYETPTAMSAVESAMNFGRAGQDKKLREQAAMAQAIGQAAAAIPALRSGVDPLLTTLGRPSSPSQALGQFQNLQPVGQQSMTTANNFLGQVGQNVRQTQQINANRSTAFDRVMETGNMIGSLAGGII